MLEQASESTNILMRFFIYWNILARAGLSFRWPSKLATESRQVNWMSELFWSSFPISEKLSCPNTAWGPLGDFPWFKGLRKEKMYWYRPKSCSLPESLLPVWALIQDRSQRQPKSHFSWSSTCSWHWFDTQAGLLCTIAQQVVGRVVAALTLTQYVYLPGLFRSKFEPNWLSRVANLI